MSKHALKEYTLSGGFGTKETKKGKVHVYEDRDVYMNNLPEGVTKDMAKALNEHSGTYVNKCLEKTVELANTEFKGKENEVRAEYPFSTSSHSSVNVTIFKKVKQIIPDLNGGPAKEVQAPKIVVNVDEYYKGAPSKAAIKEYKEELDNKFNK